MAEEHHALLIAPIVQESVQHNARVCPPASVLSSSPASCPLTPISLTLQVLSNIHSLASSLSGLTAGTLGLSSFSGFIFYLLTHLFVSLLIHTTMCKNVPGKFFYSTLGDLWGSEVVGGLMGFVLTWTLGFNLCGA